MSDQPEVPATAAADSARQRDWQNYKRLLTYVRPYTFTFILSVLGFFLASGAEAYMAQLLGDLIDNWAPREPRWRR